MGDQETFLFHDTWSQLVAGWADHLDPSGSRFMGDGIHTQYDREGSHEGTTRMLWGLGGWLSRDRNHTVAWRGTSYDTVELTRRAYLSGTDLSSDVYWGRPHLRPNQPQSITESGQVAFALWQSRKVVWDTFDAGQQQQVHAWLEHCSHPPGKPWWNNFALFWALNHTVRKALGTSYDQGVIDSVINDYLDTIYCGDGWYDDAPDRGVGKFDDYNLWVFGSHLLAWAQVDPDPDEARRDELLDRVRQLMQHMPYFFASNGAYPEYGRSLSYKFARLGALLHAYRMGLWPHSVGLLKSIVLRHIGWYVGRGAIRADNTLRQTLTAEGAPDIREPYIATGSSYWAMQAYGGLWSLDDDDPFWQASPEPLPVEQRDFVKVFPQPGWILAGTKASGEVHRFSAHAALYPAKYSKFLYSTAAPFNVGLPNGIPAPDAMFSLLDDGVPGHRDKTVASALDDQGWMRFRWNQTYGDANRTIDTAIVIRGDWHLRIHRIEPCNAGDHAPIPTIEGAAAHGYTPGDVPHLHRTRNPAMSAAASAGTCVAIVGWDHRTALHPAAWRGAEWTNSVWGRNVIPALKGDVMPGTLVISTIYVGRAPVPDLAEKDAATLAPRVEMGDANTLVVSWRGEQITIPDINGG